MGLRERLRFEIAGEHGAFVRFLVAVVGLALAFGSALMSTVTREAGDVIATAVLASSALLLSGVVAVATVPYLTKRVVANRVRDALSYDLTREGLLYLILTIVIGVAALNTGNNLLFIVVAAMLSTVLVSGVASAVILNSVQVELSLPRHVFAGQTYAGAVKLYNTRRLLPAFSISVVPPREQQSRKKWKWRRTNFVYPRRESGRKPWVQWPDVSLVRAETKASETPVFQGRIYFPFLPARQSQSAEIQLRFEKRGRYAQRAIGLATRFPFSFFTKTRTVPLEHEVLVYPAVEATDEMLEVLPMITGEVEANQRGRGTDLYRIRDYQPEDPARHVDWKSTAKSRTLKVREFTREDERRVRIVFDNPAPGTIDVTRYERGINLAASLAWHFYQENTQLRFAAPTIGVSSDVYGFLEYLALATPRNESAFLTEIQDSGEYNIVLTTRERGSIPTALWQSSYVIFLQD